MAAKTLVMDAVEQLDFRVTVGDVASSTGLALGEARRELLSLAAEAEGHLQVSGQGDMAFAFAKNFRQILTRKQQQDRQAQLRQKLWQALLYGLRISFGILLIVSIVLIILALIALQTASQQENQNNRRQDRGGGFGFFFFPNLWYGNPFWDPDGYDSDRRSRRSRRGEEKAEMNFLEAVYSFLFGDGDPNGDLDAERYRLVGQVIRAHDGVVAGEQLLPFLDVNPGSTALEYEDYMLPILVKFDGQPEVSEAGQIIYRFPELQVVAADRQKQRPPVLLQEKLWPFSRATPGQLTLAGGLGLLNLVLASMLFGLRGQVATAAAQGSGLLALINPLIGVLWIYGLLFMGIPLVRWLTLRRRNQKVAHRNQQRRQWAEQLRTPTEFLAHKLQFARQFARQAIVGQQDIIYSTEHNLVEQRDYELDRPEFQALLDSEP